MSAECMMIGQKTLKNLHISNIFCTFAAKFKNDNETYFFSKQSDGWECGLS